MNPSILIQLSSFYVLIMASTALFGQDKPSVLSHQYNVEIQLFSLIPDVGIDSYRSYGRGEVGGANATAGFVANDERQFEITVETRLRSKEFSTRVLVEPKDSDIQTQKLEREFNLSDLQQQSIEIGRNDDGRVYRLQLNPRVQEFPKPRVFEVKDLHLDQWSFRNSAVILNDQDYIGRMSMSSGQLAYLDIPGLAKIEFSLLQFRGAMPWGSLEKGVVQITHENGMSLQISDVTNGIHRKTLDGGPYQVFVRWSEPSMSRVEYQKQFEKLIAEIKQRIEGGELPAENNWSERLERAQKSDRPMMMSHGLGPIPSKDLLSPN